LNKFIATRLKKVREQAGLTQEAFARAVALSPEFISLLESGKRSPSLETLSRIAAYFHRDLCFFLEEKEPVFTVLFRTASLDDQIGAASDADLQRFKAYAEEYLRLEEETGRRLEPAPLYGANITPERLAAEERRRLDLGDEPVRNVFALFERNGCRIVRLQMPPEAQLSGAFVYIEAQAASFALINASQTFCRQIFTAAHEYCHYLKDRHDAPILDTHDVFAHHNFQALASREKFAQRFAANFLMPASEVLETVDKEFGGRRLCYDDILLAKRYFGVSALAMLRTLRDLSLISSTQFEEFLIRDPAERELEIFGSSNEECAAPADKEASKTPSDSGPDGVIVSDRYKLLKALVKNKGSSG